MKKSRKLALLSLLLAPLFLSTACGDDEAEGWSTLEKTLFLTTCKSKLSESVCDCQYDAISSQWTADEIATTEVLTSTEYLQVIADCAEF